VFQKKFFLCFLIFGFNIFCFANGDNVFYESENDRVLQLIENERMQEELYAKKREEKRLKKLKKLEEKEKKRLKKSLDKSKKPLNRDERLYSNELPENSIDSNMENFDVLSFDYVKNKQENFTRESTKKDMSTENNKETYLDVSNGVENISRSDTDDNSSKDIEKIKNFEIVTRIPSNSNSTLSGKINDKNDEIIILRDHSLKNLEKKVVKKHNKISNNVKNNKIIINNVKSKKNKNLRKQKFEFNKNVKPIYFKNDSSYITNEYKKILDSDILWLKHNSIYKILIVGHTDKLGKVEYNIKLGQDRANAVKKYFIKSGIHSSRIQTISYGSFKSKYSGNNLDRKVEILVYK